MEVRDVFEMRKEGRLEEAYSAILKLYALHQGPHTNLCMFWCTNDMFKLRARQKRVEEARRLLFQLVKLYPQTKDRMGQGNRAIINAAFLSKLPAVARCVAASATPSTLPSAARTAPSA